MKLFQAIAFFSGLFLLNSCAPTRHLSGDQRLFVGSEVEYVLSDPPEKKRFTEGELLNLARPKPNQDFRLWVYNVTKEPQKQKGFKYWLKYKIGRPPVLYDQTVVDRSKLILEKYLIDNGYLHAEVEVDTLDYDKKVKVIYEVSVNELFHIAHVYLPGDSTILAQLTRDNRGKSFLKENQIYRAENLRQERVRLAGLATQNGYYGISDNDVFFYIDTSGYVDSLDIYVRWQARTDSGGFNKFRFGTTVIYPDYSLLNAPDQNADTIRYEGLTVVEAVHYFHAELLRSAIKGQEGAQYDGRLQASTINYLQDLGVFKFINLKTEIREEEGRHYLDRIFYLTPANFRNIRYDFETNTRSGSFLGIQAAVNYENRNWLGGAEQLSLSLSVGGETQIGNQTSFINTLEVSAAASVAIPKLLIPKAKPPAFRDYVPRTRFNVSDALQIRTGFFSLNRLSAGMVYDWRSNRLNRHLVTPVSISFNQTFDIDPDFQAQLDESSLLSNSLENVFILGGQYQFTYSDQEIDKIKPYLFFTSTFKLAGNIPFAISKIIQPDKDSYGIFGTPFSQFARISVDGRYYFQRRKFTWANRVSTGLVIPYGNVDVAPYSEQFFIGGSTSLRAFRLRQLGPGSYVNPDTGEFNFFDQTGNIKLELSTEYRFDLFSYFEGAIFVDAGNIWLLNQTIGDNQDGRFSFDTFLDEIAIGTGLGLRIDFDFFLIRLDAAFPLRKPIYNQGFSWTFDQIDILDKSWRKENLVWHLAIGYPF